MSEHDFTTVETHTEPALQRGPPGLVLTLLWHPDPSRIGETALVPLVQSGAPIAISRLQPAFSSGEPLADARVSRAPLQIVPQADGGARIWPGRAGLKYTVDGAPGGGGEHLDAEALAEGAVLGLGKGALLLLEARHFVPAERDCGLVGASWQLDRVRKQILQLAGRPEPALVLGESGTGKELVSRALHQQSPRAHRPWVPVNMAALADSTAPSQLFGHARGAFTGADRASQGFFGQAHGGTLFLDEIGACPAEVQAQLLRALESGEIQPVGGQVRTVDARVVAATDEDLDAAIRGGRFRAPLYFRLARSTIRIPPLRDRRADIAAQFVWFLRERLASEGLERRLAPAGPRDTPWLGRKVVAALLDHLWPGNSRELRAVAEDLVTESGRDRRCATPDLQVGEAILAASAPAPIVAPAPAPRVELDTQDPTEDEDLEAVLRAHGYRLNAAAAALGMGINTLRRRMVALGIPRSRDLTAAQIRAALAAEPDAAAAALRLRVSEHGLKVQMKRLGIGG